MKKVKICGLSRPADIEAINILKPEFCGFIINFPKSIRNVSAEIVKKLTVKLNRDIIPVGVFVDQPAQVIADILNNGIISVAQLHGREDNQYISNLRKLTDKPIWQAFQIHSSADIEAALNSSADFVLLDAGQGKGKTFDWTYLNNFPHHFGLAGGLNIENLSDALKTKADLLDISGGVETNGIKDPYKIKSFIDTVRNY